MIDWDNIRKLRYTEDAPPPEWPEGVQAISLPGTTLLGVNPKTNKLYWDGQELSTEKRLANFERSMAIAVTVATVIMAIIEIGRATGCIAH
ncbi:MAG: hypothetical protein EOQ86_19715 [Mesorhizobium sp.]|uniref:hypothetical protein n=1 Tax=Mesorhizobium sp. TaxID=1871066 RepID=UPI000FE77142|nr:hypothetical protein [Mesorhizobium sp.]RWH76858.1 MAG: hypothetical protein EOQ85_20185 [Mesorhizobium sp.]RWH80167.1 MAG: hypothetical protein EOQ86_19715 [Mesorhizobium sp.]RWH88754.1 MAG: hypothetical protein EOQ87_20365 [Mesorhizobium sp.]RWH95611.1 MAG: hypothetical protein EOQ88_22495 [Mesorhizobium sp.]RWI01296.1 MAG: hypothetical protein EOQ89_16705 [Mesorhizobium sp.]